MGFTDAGQPVQVNNKTAATSIVSPAANMAAGVSIGNLFLVLVAKDNAATANGNTNEITSVTDTKGNTYVKAREFCNSRGAANGGVTVVVYYCVITTALVASVDTVTANFSDSRTAKTLITRQFTMAAGSSVSVVSATDLANDGADPGSMTLSGLASGEYLFFRGIGQEGENSATPTQTAGYTTNAPTSTAGGGNASNIAVSYEFRIMTGTGDTSDPSWAANDTASVFIAFKEVLGVETELIGSPFGASGQSQMSQLLAQ